MVATESIAITPSTSSAAQECKPPAISHLSIMTVPTYDQFIEPILRYLAANPAGVAAKDAHEQAAKTLGLSDDDKHQLLPSGAQPMYKNRAGWAHDRLKRAGLSESSRRGFWKITPEGLTIVTQNPGRFSSELTERLAMGYIGVRLKSPTAQVEILNINTPPQCSQGSSPVLSSPEERLGQAIQELRQSAEVELLELLSNVSPSFFESIVLDLLHRMGYGANRSDLQRVGGSGDAGIDGVISLDRLGLEKVYVQAKRWQGTVGRPELQAFYGALAGQKAKKGVFIATSSFTAQAIEFARSVEGIVLVDGTKLAGLMIDYELGVTSRTIKVPKIDGDYFDEEAA
jgi:restriction system protein